MQTFITIGPGRRQTDKTDRLTDVMLTPRLARSTVNKKRTVKN